MHKQAHSVAGVSIFKQRLLHRLKALAAESKQDDFMMPIGLVLAIDKKNGGDVTAQELVSRFGLIDFESRNVIDFYFLGWNSSGSIDLPEISFDLASFNEFRVALRAAGVREFGGNADLILVDAQYASGNVYLHFEEAIRIDLSSSYEEKNFPTLGAFLQSLIEAAQRVNDDKGIQESGESVFSISDKLGLAIARKSLLSFFLEKFGKVIGANKLATVAVRNLGPRVRLREF